MWFHLCLWDSWWALLRFLQIVEVLFSYQWISQLPVPYYSLTTLHSGLQRFVPYPPPYVTFALVRSFEFQWAEKNLHSVPANRLEYLNMKPLAPSSVDSSTSSSTTCTIVVYLWVPLQPLEKDFGPRNSLNIAFGEQKCISAVFWTPLVLVVVEHENDEINKRQSTKLTFWPSHNILFFVQNYWEYRSDVL